MTDDRQRFASRLLGFVGLWLLLSGLLMALSFVDLVLVANGVLLIAGAAAAAVWGLRRIEFERKLASALVIATPAVVRLVVRIRDPLLRHATRLGARGWKVSVMAAHAARGLGVRIRHLGVRRHLRRVGARAGDVTIRAAVTTVRPGRDTWRRLRGIGLRRHVERLGRGTRTRALDAPGRANALLARGIRSYAIAAYRLQLWTARALNAGARLATTGPRPDARLPDESLQAHRLNALGAQLRRQGEPEQAVERHRVALEIVRDLGDEQAEALTLNNLALALAQGGAEAEAVEHLEYARDVLHELGDAEHEAQVIANLGIVYRRQGHREEAETLFHEALDKLPPESTAYRQVEAELSRAS